MDEAHTRSTRADARPRWRTRATHWIRAGIVTAAVLGASFLSAGPAPAGTGPSITTQMRAAAAVSGSLHWREETALGCILATEYVGAVPPAEVDSLVHRVAVRLRREGSPDERLTRTTEAVCRRALTDHLARSAGLADA